MTKKVNKYFMIVAVVFIILSLAIPIVDYYQTKIIIFTKGEYTNAQEYESSIGAAANSIGIDNTSLLNFYLFFSEAYSTPNQESIMYKAINTLKNMDFANILSWIDVDSGNNEGILFMWYILDKVIWLFIAYCIFVIPISMVDLFYKMIKKEVD